MPMAFKIRSSKFRHIYGNIPKKDQRYENIPITRNTHDSNFCAVNPKFLAVVTETGGGGAFLCFPLKLSGRVDSKIPHVCGHAGVVLDIKFNPFNDHIIASSSEDCTVKLWNIPEDGLRTNLTEWVVDLHGHKRRVGYIEWHPTAENILLSAGFDYKCVLWNVEQAEPVNVVSCHDNTIFSMSWNQDGSLFTTSCKDKKLRVIDPRMARVAAESPLLDNLGPRAWKAVFLGDSGRIFTSYHGRYSDREIAVWDVKNLSAPMKVETIDNSSSILLPYYDQDTKVMYLAGKGDSNIRYFEIDNEAPYTHYLNSFITSDPQRGLGVMPKRGCNTEKCEVMRFYKLHASKKLIEPLSMIAPRKTSVFHEDIYPPTASQIPSLSADEWISGQTRGPILMSMLDGHVTNAPKLTSAKAVQNKDSTLSQAPTITTYKAVNRPRPEGSVSAQPYQGESSTMTNHRNIPASLRNIKQLSTSEDFITIKDDKPNGIQSDSVDAALSPTDQSTIKKVWSPTSPKVTSNGFPGGDSDIYHCQPPTARFSRDFFQAYLIKRDTQKATCAGCHRNDHNVTHVKKVWSAPQSPAAPLWFGEFPPNEAELRKAYFKQLEEITSLKEQISLKDKRIRQLEEEISMLKIPVTRDDVGPDHSDC
ncbi:coronin-2B-like isoform X2 [Ostrea edulis]|uniref:coronin-2B-like isoform X2 n=1 Tax=Ostrea edulis TaxID=37623 RepID=UPI0024AFD561|nr:coronin-2B-like isoform X2 [Ostrea edulis]XP_056004096.1 coronin-2B-like isoform X2 [Ostrea edulis]